MKFFTGLLPLVIVIGGYLWGGTTDAHLACLTHQLGNNSLKANAACVVQH